MTRQQKLYSGAPPLCQQCLRWHGRYRGCPTIFAAAWSDGAGRAVPFGHLRETILQLLAQDAHIWVNARKVAARIDVAISSSRIRLKELAAAGLVERRIDEIPNGTQQMFRISPAGLEAMAKANPTPHVNG